MKALDRFGSCQRPVFSLGVIWSSKLQENNERKHTLVAQIGVLSDAFKKASGLKTFDI